MLVLVWRGVCEACGLVSPEEQPLFLERRGKGGCGPPLLLMALLLHGPYPPVGL